MDHISCGVPCEIRLHLQVQAMVISQSNTLKDSSFVYFMNSSLLLSYKVSAYLNFIMVIKNIHLCLPEKNVNE